MQDFKILTQPNDVTCGPTSLHAIYRYYGDKISLKKIIEEVEYIKSGGTLGVLLGCHALRRGYKVTMYTFDLKIFDPTWFANKKIIPIKLEQQLKVKKTKQIKEITGAYLKYFALNGEIHFEVLTRSLLKKYFAKKTPILTGLSATYLYNVMREYTDSNNKSIENDIMGEPMGHFVVLKGFENDDEHIIVADPYKTNPISNKNYYIVNTQRLLNSIMLAVVTFDANLLVIEP
ncbi:MAG: peptidase-C39 like family protein, partial [Ignavibacteriales bacterium CG_4_9_14_3_um_filter_30_11]